MTFSSPGALRHSFTLVLATAVAAVLLGSPARAQAIPAPSAFPAVPGGQPARAASPANAPRPFINPVVGPNYQIHRGDSLNVQVYGDQSLSQVVTVLGDGTIQYPLVGQLKLSGKTPTQAADAIKGALQKYVRHPIVTVSVAQQAETDVLVFGDVKTPGRYAVRADARLTDAIAAAGGLGPTNGVFPPARVSDAAGNIHSVSLQKLLHDGDSSVNLPIENGAIVYVPGPATFQVEVVGAVDHPGNIELNEGDRLSVAVAKAGNSANSKADLNHIRVTRPDAAGRTQQSEINLYQALEKGDLQYDPILQKGDLVYVPQTRGQGSGGGVLYLLTRLLHF